MNLWMDVLSFFERYKRYKLIYTTQWQIGKRHKAPSARLWVPFFVFLSFTPYVFASNEAVIITETGGTSVTEGSSTDSYTIRLINSPSNTVTITFTPDSSLNLGSGAGVAITRTFNSGNWWSDQTITVTPVDDSVASGVHTAKIHHSAQSSDTDYNGISIPDVTVTITDNDTAGITLTQSGGSTRVSESGPTSDTYTIHLNTQPTANVTITLATDGQTTVSPSTLTFTSGNWNTTQTVTVTAVDDSASEGTHTSTITHSVSSIDAMYSGFGVPNLLVEVTDNDNTGSIILTETGGGTYVSEAGETTDTYSLVLDSAPTANVIITITPDSQTTVSPTTLTFTTANWSSPQTVTVRAVNDSSAEGPHTSTISHTVSSSDSRFNGISIADLIASVADDDSIGITLTESDGDTEVNELNTTSDTYTIKLNTQPAADVIITIINDGQITVDHSSLTFTSSNWNVAQTVTVTAVDDANAEGPHTSTLSHSVSSVDPNYSGISLRNVVVEVTDNDIAGITIAQSGGSTDVAEGGVTDSYTVVLNTQPTSNVTVSVTSDSQTTVDKSMLTFTTSNWNVAQTVTVTAVDDTKVEGPHTSTIHHSVSSVDTDYSGISVRDVVVDITDNDIAGVTISESGGSTSITEGGATDSYTVVLGTPPHGGCDDYGCGGQPDHRQSHDPDVYFRQLEYRSDRHCYRGR